MVDEVDWSKRVGKLRKAHDEAAARPDVERDPGWLAGVLDGDELEPGPDLRQALERKWSAICPQRFVNARIGDVADGAVRAKVLEWIGRPEGRNLALGGEVGCGKTYLAMAAAFDLHMASREVRFFPVVELWRLLRPGGPEGLIEAVEDCDVLVLDDLGSERQTDWSAEQLWEIVNRRWIDERPTIFTTNRIWLDLRDVVGARVYDRLVNVETVRLVLDGGSKRRG